MDLSVVIINWNSGSHLQALVQSLRPLAADLDYVCIVDNASDDDSLERVADESWLTIERLADNRGFSGAANLGFFNSRSEFVLLLNPDVRIEESAIRRLAGAIQGRRDAALICGPLVDQSGNEQRDFQLRHLPTWWSVLKDVLFLDEILGGSTYAEDALRTGQTLVEVEQPAAAYWLVRAKAWQQLEGFDKIFYPAWFEDVDFCKRLKKAGWKVLYHRECPAIHSGGISLKRMSNKQFFSLYYGNMLRYLRKHHPASYPFLWGPVKLGSWIRQRIK
jgi:GT2 family glycosyltransferase